MEEAVPFTRLRCAVHSSTALHSPSSSMRALLCHEVAEHCPVSPLVLYNKAVHIECGTTTLRSPVLPFQKPVYEVSETCVFFLLWSIPKRAVHASYWMQILYKLNTFLIVCLSSISSYLGHLRKKMGRWMGASMPQRNGMISHGCILSQWSTWEHTTKITDLPDLKAIALRVINFYKQPVYFCWTETSLLVQDVNSKLEKSHFYQGAHNTLVSSEEQQLLN